MTVFLRRAAAMAHKETLHISRDAWTLYVGLVLPLVLLVLLGFGVSFDLDHMPLQVVDLDHSPESRALIEDFTAAGEFVLAGSLASGDEAAQAFAAKQSVAVLTIPEGYARALARSEVATVGLLLDGSDGQSAQQAVTRADALARIASLRSTGRAVVPPLAAATWTRFNPAGRSALFLVPGISAYVLALVAVLLTALSVAREWERGSMEQLFCTPVRRGEIIVGKLVPYLCMGIVQVLLVLAAGAWVFGVPARGDLFTLGLASLLFMLGMLGQGVLISIITRNQMVATQASTMTSMLPSMLLSGFIFPVDNMPLLLQGISHLVPARYYIDILRGVLLKGNGLSESLFELAMLVAFASLMMGLSLARFRRKLA
ncbi:MAG: ABC transporter permease [Myxococcota bacterium]